MLQIRLDSPVPLTDQIESALRRAIARGEVRPGDELPPVRQLAADLGVNLNTVARAYNALQDSGLIRTARGRGTRVTSAVETNTTPDQDDEAVHERMRDAIADARLSGMDRKRTAALLTRVIDEFFGSTAPKEAIQ